MKLFSHKNRPVHLGPYPYELLKRQEGVGSFESAPATEPLSFEAALSKESFAQALPKVLASLLTLRDGACSRKTGAVPDSPVERAKTMKSWVYHEGLVAAGVCRLSGESILTSPIVPCQTLSKAISSQKALMQKMAASMAPQGQAAGQQKKDEPGSGSIKNEEFASLGHSHALVIVAENRKQALKDQPGHRYLAEAMSYLSSLSALEVAVLVAGYLRTIGFPARAHSRYMTEVDLNKLALSAGVTELRNGKLRHPYIDNDFSIAVVTTTMEMAEDKPLATRGTVANLKAFGLRYQLGLNGTRQGIDWGTGKNRPLHMGKHPMEKIKRQEKATTIIDEPNIPRVPKRHDMFTRGAHGDLGTKIQELMQGMQGFLKEPYNHTTMKIIAGNVPLQRGKEADRVAEGTSNAGTNANDMKALCYAVGSDLVGICEAKDYMWYSHDKDGSEIVPYHKNAIIMLLDQGYETMSGASGDDWITGSQGAKGYRRGSITANIVAEHIRRLGHSARVHSLVDQDVLHIPMLLEAGIGELSRIGELVLNPFMGPRFKSVVITTDMPLASDKPINFGLQNFCNNCLKCARECPVGCIPYGDKIMFNGYETWKQDVEKCAKYRITNPAGTGCGRCMKTCPWNTEGVLSERLFINAAIRWPVTHKWIAKLDDWLGNGKQNPVKQWWFNVIWDKGEIVVPEKTNTHDLNLNRVMDPDKQRTAIFPIDIAPKADQMDPVRIVDFRKEAQRRYKAAETPEAYKQRIKTD